jgi:hypothetical protein
MNRDDTHLPSSTIGDQEGFHIETLSPTKGQPTAWRGFVKEYSIFMVRLGNVICPRIFESLVIGAEDRSELLRHREDQEHQAKQVCHSAVQHNQSQEQSGVPGLHFHSGR